MKFCLLTAGRGTKPTAEQAEFVFFAHSVDDLRDQQRRFYLTAHDIELLNPNTRTCPIFRTRNDAELAKAIYRRVPVLIREARDGEPEQNPWSIKFKQGLFNMTSDSHLFKTREQLEVDGWELDGNVFRKGDEEYLPLYEGRMIHHFDHRIASVGINDENTFRSGVSLETNTIQYQDPNYYPMPRYWVNDKDVNNKKSKEIRWVNVFKDITSSTNERTFISTIIPAYAVGNKSPLIITDNEKNGIILSGILSTLCVDFIARQKVGGVTLNFYLVKQFPIISNKTAKENLLKCDDITSHNWLNQRILELTYTAWDLKHFAKDCGFDGPPFRWDEDRRFLIRCELDAAFFHLYLPAKTDGNWKKAESETEAELATLCAAFPTPRDAVDYIMDTFPIVKRKDEAKYGEYRTKRTILEIYDAMQNAIATGQPYQTRLDPPPADRRCCHPEEN